MKPAPQMPLAAIVTTDLAAITRGRPVPADRLPKYAEAGVGWVPANLCLTPFNTIADPNPWGSTGDLRIVPDMEARYHTDLTGASTPFDMVMGTITDLDGAPWEACPRSLLRDALADLRSHTGLSVRAAFEQELRLASAAPAGHAFSFEALRGADPFAPILRSALEDAGVHPEMVLAEYGAHQFEITCEPADALVAADRAVAIREITREVARQLGTRASFSPKPDPGGVGNGVHIHFSLVGADGAPATYDPAGPARMSGPAAMFAAGILRHLPAITVLTAASVPSFLRLRPHSWSASYTSLADRDREASLRICPTVTIGGRDPSRQFNIEYRAADATANPYLALAAIVRAGLEGIRAGLPAPPVTTGDPSTMSEAERAAGGLVRLPQSLGEALDAFTADTVVRGWFTPAFVDSYVGVKRAEMAYLEGRSPAETCALYGTLY
jgi:glutamine synthetase